MPGVSSGNLLELLGTLDGAPSGRPWTEAALGVWKGLVPGHYYSALHCRRQGSRSKLEALFQFGHGWSVPDERILANLEKIGWVHPVTQRAIQENRPAIFRRSELVGERNWRNTDHFNLVDQPLGIVDMSVLFLPMQAGLHMMLVCGRDRIVENPEPALARLPHLMARLLPHAQPKPPVKRVSSAKLTNREAEVMHWVSEGKRNAEIALILDLSPLTVRTHLEHIYAKLDVDNRVAAVLQWAA